MFNARSIMSKFPELEMWAHQKNLDLILITELWTHSQISNAEIILKGYDTCRNDREERRGGGCFIYYRSVLPVSENNRQNSKLSTKSIQSQWIEVKAKGSQFRIGLYYNSPSSTEGEQKLMLEKMQSLNDHSGNTIICGDFNLPSINWMNM